MNWFSRITNRAPVPAAGPSSSQSAGSGITLEQRITAVNRWRDSLNPLRSLTLARAVTALESAQRGQFPDLEWYYRFIERRDPDLIALIERRTGALKEMNWNVKTLDEKTADQRGIAFDETLAKKQAGALRAAYNKLDNLYAAISHLAMASFREFAIAQLHDENGKPAAPGAATHVELLDQWNFCREGHGGDFFWNPESKMTDASTLGETNRIAPLNNLIRVWERPLDEIAFIKFVRSSLCDKDWDSFVEIFGVPGGVVIMPANVPAGKEADYQTAAESVAEGASGALPSGSDIKWPDSVRGSSPFRDRSAYLTEKLILAGTGGLLTMLAQSGSGTLAGSAHMEAFRLVARAEAREIGELFQKQFDKILLDTQFPGAPVLAYFELAANDTPDTGAMIKEILDLSSAGFAVDPAQVQEKTGYIVTVKVVAPPAISPAGSPAVVPLANRQVPTTDPTDPSDPPDPLASSRDSFLAQLTAARAQAAVPLKPFFARLENIVNDDQATDEQMLAALELALKDLPRFAGDLDTTAFRNTLEQALAQGIVQGGQESKLAGAKQ